MGRWGGGEVGRWGGGEVGRWGGGEVGRWGGGIYQEKKTANKEFTRHASPTTVAKERICEVTSCCGLK